MRYLIIAALLLAGCKTETNQKQEACLALGDGYRWANYYFTGYCYKKFTGGKPNHSSARYVYIHIFGVARAAEKNEDLRRPSRRRALDRKF